jgi:hypothetical protein
MLSRMPTSVQGTSGRRDVVSSDRFLNCPMTSSLRSVASCRIRSAKNPVATRVGVHRDVGERVSDVLKVNAVVFHSAEASARFVVAGRD